LLVVDGIALCEPDLSLDRERRPRNGGLRGGAKCRRRLFVCKAEVVAISGEGEETPCAALQQNIATAPAENNKSSERILSFRENLSSRQLGE
jgi:hypothetical protein